MGICNSWIAMPMKYIKLNIRQIEMILQNLWWTGNLLNQKNWLKVYISNSIILFLCGNGIFHSISMHIEIVQVIPQNVSQDKKQKGLFEIWILNDLVTK